MQLRRYFPEKSDRLDLKKSNYLKFIRSQVCCITERPNPDAHHVQFVSQGRNDYTAIPICHELHMKLHAIGPKRFAAMYNIDYQEQIIVNLCRYLIKYKHNPTKPANKS